MRIWCLRVPLLRRQAKTRHHQLGTQVLSRLGPRTISSRTWILQCSKWPLSFPFLLKIIHPIWYSIFSRIRRNNMSSPHTTWTAWTAPAHRNSIQCRCMTNTWALASSLWNQTKWIFNILFPTMVGEIKFLSLLAINPPQSSILNNTSNHVNGLYYILLQLFIYIFCCDVKI